MPNQYFIQGQTAHSPAMQDVMRGHEDYYQSNLAYLQQQMKMEQIQGAARVGADRLASLGPEGQRWAQHLISDPYGAMMAAEQYGGFGALENRLMYETAADGMGMDPLSAAVLQGEGAQGIAQIGQGEANSALAKQRMAVVDAIKNLIGGGTTGFGTDSSAMGGEMASGAANMDLNTLSALGLVNPEMARAQLAIRKAAREPGEQAISTIQGIAKTHIADLAKIAEDWKFVRDIDFENPSTDAWLSKLFVRQVEPGLMVTQAESGDVELAATSGIGAVGMRILRTLTPSGKFTKETRRMMAEAIHGSLSSRAQSKLQFIQGLEQEAGSLLGYGPNLSRAIIGDDASRVALEDYINNPIDYDQISENWRDMPNKGVPISERPSPPPNKLNQVTGKVIKPEWDEDAQQWYYEMPEE